MVHTIGVVWLLHLFWLGFPLSPSAHTFPEVKPDEDKYHVIIARAAKRHQVEIELVKALIMVESGYDPEAVSDSGARGLMQLMPATAEMFGVEDCFDPHQNVNAGVAYFKQLKDQFDGNVIIALAAYNAGPTRVRKCGGIPRLNSTRKYILKVLTYYFNYKRQIEWFRDLLQRHWELRGADDLEEEIDTIVVQKEWRSWNSIG